MMSNIEKTFSDVSVENDIVSCVIRYKNKATTIKFPLNFECFDPNNRNWFLDIHIQLGDLVGDDPVSLDYLMLYYVAYPIQARGYNLVAFEIMYQLGTLN